MVVAVSAAARVETAAISRLRIRSSDSEVLVSCLGSLSFLFSKAPNASSWHRWLLRIEHRVLHANECPLRQGKTSSDYDVLLLSRFFSRGARCRLSRSITFFLVSCVSIWDRQCRVHYFLQCVPPTHSNHVTHARTVRSLDERGDDQGRTR